MKLLGAGTKTNTSGYVGASTPITFISPGEGLSKGLHNPYSDDGRSEYFFSFYVDPVRTLLSFLYLHRTQGTNGDTNGQ